MHVNMQLQFIYLFILIMGVWRKNVDHILEQIAIVSDLLNFHFCSHFFPVLLKFQSKKWIRRPNSSYVIVKIFMKAFVYSKQHVSTEMGIGIYASEMSIY